MTQRAPAKIEYSHERASRPTPISTEQGPSRATSRWVALGAGFAFAWLTGGFLAESRNVVWRQVVSPPSESPVGLWRYGQPESDALRRFLGAVRRQLPTGARVAFASLPTSREDEWYRFFWASFELADHEVMPAFRPWPSRLADHLVAYQTRVDDPRWRLLWRNEAGAVYRLAGTVPRGSGS